jgi:RimJ/RimL family protein N-acetyltransferase
VSTITLRPARQGDACLLLGWVNAPETLAQKKLTQGPIDQGTHEAWLARRLTDPATVLRIIVRDGTDVGQVRLQSEDGVALVDVHVTPQERRGGVATAALRQAMASLPDSFAHTARAEVRKDNAPSRRLFERLGFVLTESSYSFVTYDHPLPLKGERP